MKIYKLIEKELNDYFNWINSVSSLNEKRGCICKCKKEFINIFNDENGLNFEILFFGDKNNLNIEVDKNNLIVKYKNDKVNNNEENRKYFLKGFDINKDEFEYIWKISEDEYDLNKINAKLENNILRILIPYNKENKRRIEID